jgi:hypothetical protein
MLKKIVLVALFLAPTTIAAAGTAFAHSAPKVPVPMAPKGICAPGMRC